MWTGSKKQLEASRNKLIAYNYSRKGKKIGPLSKETKSKISNSLTGTKLTEERKHNISISLKGHTSWNKGKELSEETKIKMSIAHKRPMPNPMSEQGRKNISIAVRKRYLEHPETHPNAILAKNGHISKGQKILYSIIRTWYWSKAELNYKIKTNEGIRYCDIGIPSEKLDIEYDDTGYWHVPELDKVRDLELEKIGWNTIRVGRLVV